MNFYRSSKRSQADSHQQFNECPRCGEHSLEHLSSYSHCTNCLHFADHEVAMLPSEFSISNGREFPFLNRKKFS